LNYQIFFENLKR